MKKPLALAVLGITAALIMGADDSCNTDDSSTKPAKHANNNSKPESNAPDLTTGQENALAAAQSYIEMSPFSKAGLIQQLSSSAGEGYPKSDATWAVNQLDVNWNEQAYRAAKGYLDMSSFSLDSLIQQLASPAGEQFTQKQAEYGATKAYNE